MDMINCHRKVVPKRKAKRAEGRAMSSGKKHCCPREVGHGVAADHGRSNAAAEDFPKVQAQSSLQVNYREVDRLMVRGRVKVTSKINRRV